jgi:hypothetical protein
MLFALTTNIRLDWKGLAGTDTLAYYEHSSITDVKSFIKLGLGILTKEEEESIQVKNLFFQ